MGLKLITAPTVEPVTLADTYLQCYLVPSGSPPVHPQDSTLTRAIASGRRAAESYTRRALMTQTWELWLDRFPGEDARRAFWHRDSSRAVHREDFALKIPLPPLQSITSVKYIDETGAEQTMDPSAYQLDDASEPAQLFPAVGTCWPRTQCDTVGSVKVRFVAGYGDAEESVPEDIRSWILMRVGHWFENREATAAARGSGSDLIEVPFVDELLNPYRVLEVV